MKWNSVPLAVAQPQPWRNGGGVTRELLAWPDAAGWQARISVADVRAAGPFSRFDGIERWFAVLEGEGVALRVAGEHHRLTPASLPLRFDGAAAVDCSLLAGATRDLNLMAAPGRARMARVAGEHAFATAGPALLAVYAHGQPATVQLGDAHCAVPAFHLAWRLLDAPAAGVARGAHAFWMEITR
jgi:environmental stress-induced protein Ves